MVTCPTKSYAKMAEAHYRYYLWTSEDYRVSEFLNIEHMERYRAKGGVGIYRGGNPGELESTLSSFVTSNSSYKGPLVITVNTHGLENTGNFCDTAAGTRGEIEVTPVWALIIWGGTTLIWRPPPPPPPPLPP